MEWSVGEFSQKAETLSYIAVKKKIIFDLIVIIYSFQKFIFIVILEHKNRVYCRIVQNIFFLKSFKIVFFLF